MKLILDKIHAKRESNDSSHLLADVPFECYEMDIKQLNFWDVHRLLGKIWITFSFWSSALEWPVPAKAGIKSSISVVFSLALFFQNILFRSKRFVIIINKNAAADWKSNMSQNNWTIQ